MLEKLSSQTMVVYLCCISGMMCHSSQTIYRNFGDAVQYIKTPVISYLTLYFNRESYFLFYSHQCLWNYCGRTCILHKF